MQLTLPMGADDSLCGAMESTAAVAREWIRSLPRGEDVVSVRVLHLSPLCPAGISPDDIATAANNDGRYTMVYESGFLTGVDRRGTLEQIGFMASQRREDE